LQTPAPTATPTQTPTATPTPTPTPTPEPSPAPLWMAVPPPEWLLVEDDGWQAFVDWLAPRGQRYDLRKPIPLPDLELLGDYVYITFENPHLEDLEIVVIATLEIADTTVIRTPFGLRRENPRQFTIHRGSPFRDRKDAHSLHDGKRFVVPAGESLSVPLVALEDTADALLQTDLKVASLVALGRGPRLDFGSSTPPSASAIATGLQKTIEEASLRNFTSATFGVDTFGVSAAVQSAIDAQTRLILPPMPRDPAQASVLSASEARESILNFLLNVDLAARNGRSVLPSLISPRNLLATVNGGAELELTLDVEPGEYRVSAVILSGLQRVSVTHSDGAIRDAIRPLAGMAVSNHPVRLASRGGTVRVPIVRWNMQPGQEAVISSHIEIKTLAVLMQDPHAPALEKQPPRIRRIANLEVSR